MSFQFRKMAVAVLLATATISTLAAQPAKENAGDLADQIVKKLESSGALDRMLDKAVDRRIERDQKERAKAQQDQARQASLLARNARPVSSSRDRIYGNPKADISIIVYSDLECPYCKRFNGTPEAALKSFGGKVNMVWRHFPLPNHGEAARKEAVAADCVAKQAGNDGFFKFVNHIFEKSALNGKGVPGGDEALMALAKDSGAKDEKAFDACMRDPAMAKAVNDDLDDGGKAGVRGTPGNVVRNNKTGASVGVSGAIPQAQVEDLLRQAISGQGPFAPAAATGK